MPESFIQYGQLIALLITASGTARVWYLIGTLVKTSDIYKDRLDNHSDEISKNTIALAVLPETVRLLNEKTDEMNKRIIGLNNLIREVREALLSKAQK